MKDYPDAQEILQTLGRKRLMEVRCVNKKYAKSQTDKQGGVGPRNRQKQLSYVTIQNDNSGENAASKKVDDKLKNDVKELINVLKKSRNSRLRNEAIEMQHIRNLSPKNCRSEISQMPCAFSEETDEKLEEKIEKSNYTSSPIGAGLPLLQRLRLLKEKQVCTILFIIFSSETDNLVNITLDQNLLQCTSLTRLHYLQEYSGLDTVSREHNVS
uniref:Uncharacterized protein n=1 Tax=Glossina palpalis gambiensis TaxID=67801 RepID=A0A1B0BM61_9MUSC